MPKWEIPSRLSINDSMFPINSTYSLALILQLKCQHNRPEILKKNRVVSKLTILSKRILSIADEDISFPSLTAFKKLLTQKQQVRGPLA